MRVIKIVTLSAILALTLQAKQKDDRFVVHDIVPVQMPGKFLKSGELPLSANQMQQLQEDVRPLMHEQYNVMMQEAFLVQRKIARGIENGKDAQQLQPLLDQLTKIKREAIDIKITAYNNFLNLLNDEQKKLYKQLKRK
ncbi:MAG: hypothetical protein ACQESH_07230 [Campylobacterota bacterium]